MAPALQISIPTTTTSTTAKPYTIYNISLNLPLRTHTLQKRYSDFIALHSALQSETSSAPPAPLPPKSYLRSTVSSAALTSQRREALEAYLRAILTSEDPKWRSAPSFRAFLELPKSLSSDSNTPSNHDRDPAPLDPTTWLQLHRDIKTQLHNARLAVRKRESAATAQEQHAASADAKSNLVRAATTIAQLEGSLKTLSSGGGEWGSSGLGAGEVRRRRDMLASSRSEVEGLETQLRSLALSSRSSAPSDGGSGAATAADKAPLFAAAPTAVKQGRVLGGKETERTRELDNSGVLQLQKQIMQEQDEDVLELGKAVSRMKEMGIMINEELVVQNQMLGLVEEDVTRLQGKLEVGKKRIAKIR